MLFFDIQPTIITEKGAVFFIKLTNNKFKFSGSCLSVATDDSENVKALDENKY